MPVGTLCIARSRTESETYRAMFFSNDSTLPRRALRLEGSAGVRSFLAAVGVDASKLEVATDDATMHGVALLANIALSHESVDTHGL